MRTLKFQCVNSITWILIMNWKLTRRRTGIMKNIAITITVALIRTDNCHFCNYYHYNHHVNTIHYHSHFHCYYHYLCNFREELNRSSRKLQLIHWIPKYWWYVLEMIHEIRNNTVDGERITKASFSPQLIFPTWMHTKPCLDFLCIM